MPAPGRWLPRAAPRNTAICSPSRSAVTIEMQSAMSLVITGPLSGGTTLAWPSGLRRNFSSSLASACTGACTKPMFSAPLKVSYVFQFSGPVASRS